MFRFVLSFCQELVISPLFATSLSFGPWKGKGNGCHEREGPRRPHFRVLNRTLKGSYIFSVWDVEGVVKALGSPGDALVSLDGPGSGG